jgi:hypothetical protein
VPDDVEVVVVGLQDLAGRARHGGAEDVGVEEALQALVGYPGRRLGLADRGDVAHGQHVPIAHPGCALVEDLVERPTRGVGVQVPEVGRLEGNTGLDHADVSLK